MLLSDTTIAQLLEAGDIRIEPSPTDKQMQPVSVDLGLDDTWVRFSNRPEEAPLRLVAHEQVVRPGEFLLASTEVVVTLPRHIAALVKGKSTWARRGIMVESAGLIDPGFHGKITLEIKNLGPLPRLLRRGDMVCQILFLPVDRAVTRPYGSGALGSHYQGQDRAEPARG